MNHEDVSLDRQTWQRFLRVFRNLTASEAGRKASRMFVGLIGMLLAINGMNVANSYVGRDFMTAIENRDTAQFVIKALIYAGMFGAITIVAVIYRYTEESLGLFWREWLTKRLVGIYLEHPTYYRLNDRLAVNGEILNPDQRIAEDVRAFTVTTLSFVLLGLNGLFTVVAFSGVMWTISPLLFGITVLYAGVGSYLTFVLGRPLVGLNYTQLDKEANFRSGLIHVRENAESIAVLRREGRISARVQRQFEEVVQNFRRMILVNRNLGFFTTGYNYMIQVIPAVVVAPMFIRGDAEFGVIPQAAMAFAHLLGAFSLVVTQFQSISSFAAVIARLGSLVEGLDQAQRCDVCPIEVVGDDGQLCYENLRLNFPGTERPLVDALSLTISVGTRVLVTGPNETANAALFRATAGVWDYGEGRIVRPQLDQIMFLPERPYLPAGTLRELLLRTGQEFIIGDAAIRETLTLLGLGVLLERSGGLDAEQDWDNLLSLGEQQLVAFARLLIAAPRFALLDRLSSALDSGEVERLLGVLDRHGISYIVFGETEISTRCYDAVLELAGDGHWTYKTVAASAETE